MNSITLPPQVRAALQPAMDRIVNRLNEKVDVESLRARFRFASGGECICDLTLTLEGGDTVLESITMPATMLQFLEADDLPRA